ncbi:MAG: hypothetical protein JW969_14135 [Spirochaetales bacterium]|nr:hypothetical protein [Spirochaetales bacterium]
MNGKKDMKIEEILKKIEFPGENEEWIMACLSKTEFVRQVMSRVNQKMVMARKVVFWVVFSLANLFLLSLFSADRTILQNIINEFSVLTTLYYVFLGMAFVGGLMGLIFNMDTSWLNQMKIHDIYESILKSVGKIIKK